MLCLLVVEDIPAIRKRTVRYFTETLSGYEVHAAASRDEALSLLPQVAPDLILLDLVLPAGPADRQLSPGHGEAVLTLAKQLRPQTKVVVCSAEGQLTRDFLKEKSADDFFTKDSPEAWVEEKLPTQVERLIGHLACRSAAMRELRSQLAELAPSSRRFLITGPSGSGKRHLASILHRCGPAAAGPLELLSLPTVDGEGLRARLEAQRSGTLILTGLEHTELVAKSTQLVLASALGAPADTGPLLVVTASTPWDDLLSREGLIPELAREARRTGRLRMPGLDERAEDLAELAECFRRAGALTMGRPVRRLSEAAHAALLAALRAGKVEGEAAGLCQVVSDAVARASGQAVEPQDLGLELEAEYHVVLCRDGKPVTSPVSRPELQALEADGALELVLYAEPEGDGWRVARLRLRGEERVVDDERVGRLLFLLAVQPGKVVQVRAHKHALGLIEHEQARRYVFLLRQLLDDTEFEGRNSRFISSHYGEAYSFSREVPYCLVRRLPRATSPS